jgi:hypothetical protein
MATRQAQFTAIPALPQVGLQPWQYYFYSALKSNMEMLTGGANGVDNSRMAITSGQITVAAPPTQNMAKVTADGSSIGLKDEKVTVPISEDYVKLVSNVQTLANDVASLRSTVETLIKQLKATP